MRDCQSQTRMKQENVYLFILVNILFLMLRNLYEFAGRGVVNRAGQFFVADKWGNSRGWGKV